MPQPKFDFELQVALQERSSGTEWWAKNQSNSANPVPAVDVSRKKLNTDHHCSISILPKPPKLELTMPSLRKTYYIDEKVDVELQLLNAEEDTTEIRLSVSLSGSREATPTLFWCSVPTEQDELQDIITHAITSRLEDYLVGQVAPGQSKTESFSFQTLTDTAEFLLVVRVDYFNISDPHTPLSKQIKEKITFISPFEASYAFPARVHPEAWPSYFHVADRADPAQPTGLKQLWALEAKIHSFGIEPLLVESTSIEVVDTKFSTTCTLLSSDGNDKATLIQPDELIDRAFPFEVQKATIEDRRAGLVSFRLVIAWHREVEPEKTIKTSLLVPSFTVSFGEPRVLASAQTSPANTSIIQFTYTMENPSTHFLTFSLTMETSEDFAFSGAKAMTTQLVPLSRHTVKYNLLPTRQGVWIRPVLRIVDTGFGQELRPLPAEGCKVDKKGLAVWADAE